METKTKKALYEAMLSRDPRNDGRFFIGVKTTGIYCRPICPAKPKFENVEFFRSKAESEKAGYRPCLRCRPDFSALSPRWLGTAAVMNRAVKVLTEVDQRGGELSEVSERLGMSDRHLRRLFDEHLGASPIEVAISQRLHLARQLLGESSLSILDIALASGFGSLRRFNDAFLRAYKVSPGVFRKTEEALSSSPGDFSLVLPYSGPFDWENFSGFFKRHLASGIEVFDGDVYFRHFVSSYGHNFYSVKHRPQKSCFEVRIRVASLADLRPTIERIRRQFDLAHNPFHISLAQTSENQEFHKLRQELHGMRIPGSFDPFEVAVSLVLSQLVSTERARDLLRKLIELFGEKIPKPFHPGLTHLFPRAQILMDADLEGMGLTRVRAQAIRSLSRLVHDGSLDLGPSADLDATRKALLAIKGFGPWTVEAIAMRCLSDADAFPANDLIVARALKKFGLDKDDLSPWRAYLALAIWKTQAQLLSKKGRKSHE